MTELYLQCLILSLLEEAKVKIRQNFARNLIPQNSKKQKDQVKILLKRLHLNGITVRFHPQTKKLELHAKYM